MGVAPLLLACAFHVSQGYIHAADVARSAVDDAEFAVVAVVHLAGEHGETHGHERLNLHATPRQVVEKAVANAPTTHVIVYQTHLYALLSLVDEGVGNQSAQRIVFNNVRA